MMLQNILYRIYNFCIDVLSPSHCVYCKEFLTMRTAYCVGCEAKLQPVVTIMMPVTSTKSVKVFSAAAYKEPIRSLIMAKSWSDHVAGIHLGDLIWKRTDIKNIPFDYLVPVPLHWTRYARRGFNQAEEIAKQISKTSDRPWVLLLKRKKRTPFQSVLKSNQRMANVADAFVVNTKQPTLYKDKHLVIVDDLCTTGATLRAAAKRLFELKPASISVVVAARVID